MGKMNCCTLVLFCICVLISFVSRAAYADKEDISEELVEEEYSHSGTETNVTESEELSLESHEAMTKGGEFNSKPKFTTTTATMSSSNNREKRSYEFLLGLVNNNSKFQVTNTEDDTRTPNRDKVFSKDLGASELLLEMMVKIAAHPDQWEQVHNLLQKIDTDLKTSKNIINKMQTSRIDNATSNEVDSSKTIEINKKLENTRRKTANTTNNHSKISQYLQNISRDSNIQQEGIHENQLKHKILNDTEDAIKNNQWAYGIVKESPSDLPVKDEDSTTRYPWERQQNKPVKNGYPKNFAYHRVTGNPLYHTNNNPKAYIAVSVIAPKPMDERPTEDDLVLENELRELKPWTHNQNLKNMASLRSRWVIQSDKVKP